MPEERRTLRSTLIDYLADRHTIAGWEKAALWLLIAACLGLDVAGVDLSAAGDRARDAFAALLSQRNP